MDRVVRFSGLVVCVSGYPNGVGRCSYYQSWYCDLQAINILLEFYQFSPLVTDHLLIYIDLNLHINLDIH